MMRASESDTRFPCTIAQLGGSHERRRFQHQHPEISKTLGVSAQREIEKAVREALAQGRLKGNEKLAATATITLGSVGLKHEIKSDIELG